MIFKDAIKIIENFQGKTNGKEKEALKTALASMNREWAEREKNIIIFMKTVEGVAGHHEGGDIAAFEFLKKNVNLPKEDVLEAGRRLGLVD